MSDSPTFHLGMFNKHVGEKFKLRHESGDCTLELVEAVGTMGQLDDDSRNFSLMFNGPEWSVNSYLPQSIYHLEHDTLGELEMFLVPMGEGVNGRTGIDYEAVFAAPY